MNGKSRDRVKRGRKAKKKGRSWSTRSRKKRGNLRGKAKMIIRKILRKKKEKGLRQWER